MPLLSPHPLIADVGFVLVVFTAVYVRRFGPRGTALGMVTFMSYFFSLYLRAKFSELPWLIGATLVVIISLGAAVGMPLFAPVYYTDRPYEGVPDSSRGRTGHAHGPALGRKIQKKVS